MQHRDSHPSSLAMRVFFRPRASVFLLAISRLGEGVLMETEACVDAVLKGLDDGEFITAPSGHDETLVRDYEDASSKLLAATQQSQPAARCTPRG
jgi:uncharacterized protein